MRILDFAEAREKGEPYRHVDPKEASVMVISVEGSVAVHQVVDRQLLSQLTGAVGSCKTQSATKQ